MPSTEHLFLLACDTQADLNGRMIRSLRLSGYRSLRDLRLSLSRVTVLRGANGTGKTNVYRALRLISSLARGEFAQAVATEGGMRSLLWAGNQEHARMTTFSTALDAEDFAFEMECGLRPAAPGDTTLFKLDPDIKKEVLRAGGRLVAKRSACLASLSQGAGRLLPVNEPVGSSESMLTLVRDIEKHPQLLHTRLQLAAWRFYHGMRTDAEAPARRPVRGYWSPVLAEDASNLPAVIQSINETDQAEVMHAAISAAFPGCHLQVQCGDWFSLSWQAHNLPRDLAAHELSDGTLQFICLAAVLCSPRPPPLLVLNEPETSLSEAVFPALADLVAHASRESQIIVVSHSEPLCREIAARCNVRTKELTMRFGDTRLRGQENAKSCFVIDDEDEDSSG